MRIRSGILSRLGFFKPSATASSAQRIINIKRQRVSTRPFSMHPMPLTTGPYREKHATCSAEEKKFLDFGDAAINEVKNFLPFGAGNIYTDMEKSGGRSFEHRVFARSVRYEGKPAKNEREAIGIAAAIAVACEGGNCGEHSFVSAAVLNKVLPKGTPINLCYFDGLDHAFTVIGDMSGPRDRLVVVDAWPSAAQAVLAKDFKFGDPKDLKVRTTFTADGRDIISPYIKNVYTPDHKRAIEADAPPIDGETMEKDDHLWADTHVAEQGKTNLFMVYDVSGRSPGRGMIRA